MLFQIIHHTAPRTQFHRKCVDVYRAGLVARAGPEKAILPYPRQLLI